MSKKKNKFSFDKKLAIFGKTNGKCFYCGCEISSQNRTIDHIIPLVKGGTNDLENLVPSCRGCNSAKGNRSLSYLRANRSGCPSFSEYQLDFLHSIGFPARKVIEEISSSYIFHFETLKTNEEVVQ